MPKRRPKKKPEPKCLVLYPVDHEDYYLQVFSPAIARARVMPIAVSRILTTSSRIKKVQEMMAEAHLVLADVSGRDKDVLFRAGLAEALGKPVGIIAESIEDIPSDLQHIGYAVYDIRKPTWADDLRNDIIELIGEALGRRR